MHAGACSSCGTTAFSGTNTVRRHGHGSGVKALFGKKTVLLPRSSRRSLPLSVQAIGGGEKPDDKKMLTRDEEPEQFWQTKTEAKGENPIKDPLAIIGIVSILLPFIILGIAIGTGVVDVSAGSSYGKP
ncbi:g1863 [Coccomyxa viridis]|uniref:G1863 protein n=1 Tax=Coccomyxa viridis TaxID=1274662 RepID=A0ABP1FJ10_9CHLO